MGGGFKMPCVLATDGELRQWADRHQVKTLVAEAGAPLPRVEPGPVALVVGNEGAGISDTVLQMAAGKVGIPLRGGAESLNVAIAAGILLYEVTRD
jgi:TrmH family RNA methyltransferase